MHDKQIFSQLHFHMLSMFYNHIVLNYKTIKKITKNIIFSLYSFTQMIFDCKIQDMIYYHKDFIYIIFILQINNITLYL